jgi:hypothetical protein
MVPRIAHQRSALCLAAAVATLTLDCAGARTSHQVGLEGFWNSYESLPQAKALVIAGEPDGVWVAGAAGGEASPEAAEASAMEMCARRRHERRLAAPCRIYARGSKIVWGESLEER